MSSRETIAVIDFETTGASPGQGARATEVGAVLVCEGRIVGRYQSLMRSGVRVPPFIERLTGITNRMLADAPPAEDVMHEVTAFTAGCGLVAHNAAFDRVFWRHEQMLAGCGGDAASADFACTLLLSRRLYPEVPNHKLGTLAQWHGIAPTGRAHRALADAEMAAGLWLTIAGDLQQRYELAPSFELLRTLQRTPQAGVARLMARHAAAGSVQAVAAEGCVVGQPAAGHQPP